MALGVTVGVIAGVTLAVSAPELELLDALHLAPYAGFSGGGAGGAAGFGLRGNKHGGNLSCD